jgi:PAS domain S-box-containing protein
MTPELAARGQRLTETSSSDSDGAFETLLTSTTFGIVAIDDSGRVLLWNRGAERIFGWDREEVLGQPIPVIPPEVVPSYRELSRRILEGESRDGLEMPHLRKDGSRVDVLLSLRPVQGRFGADRAILGMVLEREEEADREELARQVEGLEYRLAESQLPPHFLFNALNAVATLLQREDREEAVKMLGRLGDVLRHSLGSGPGAMLPLERECEVLGKYLEVERARFGDRLEVELEVGSEAERAEVPNLMLQPLVENALHHGLLPRSEGGRLALRARREGDRLRVRVEDDGVGLPEDWARRADEGIGIRGVRARLRGCFGDDFDLRLSRRRGGGTVARLDLPYRPAERTS